MRHPLLLPSLTGLVLLATGGCAGGSNEDPATSVRIRCLDGQSFCIISCDLGCSQTGCSVTEISENQRLRFKFSDRVQAASVNSASISIRTASGVAPDGDFLVRDSEVTFVPRVQTVNGVSSFGFLRNESYIITIAGGPSAAFGVRSLTGDRLSSEFSCTVVASRGVLDEDQAPPSAVLLSPTNLTSASRTPTIVLRFSELIDTTPLQGQLGAGTPIRVTQRSTLTDGTCNLDVEGNPLGGLPQIATEFVNGKEVTVVSVQPPQLPANSCITVFVTPNLRDLAGTPALSQQFQFITEQGEIVIQTIRETFSTGANQEELSSGGLWASGARPGQIGSDGRHGPFRPEFGNQTPSTPNVFVWDLSTGFTIPGSNTPDGNPVTVTDGRFFFSDFVLPEGVTVRFRGSVVPQIFVRGRIDIAGTVDVSGVDQPFTIGTLPLHVGQRISAFNARGAGNLQVIGQSGSAGGPGAGAGGKGGDECPGNVVATAANNGQPGDDLRLRAGHAYAGTNVGTGGSGSPVHPANGLAASAGTNPIGSLSPPSLIYRSFFSPGGGGGGYLVPGNLPALPTIAAPFLQPSNGPAGPVSASFNPLPFPASPPAGYSSLDHFLIGGSGGGGGGSCPFGTFASLQTVGNMFFAGHGGTGGGGAIALRSGGGILVRPTGSILARGGDGVLITANNPANDGAGTYDTDFGFSSPGGGGSGGTVLLQSARDIVVDGSINARGGLGSRCGGANPSQSFLNVIAQAGNGAPGFYRLEASGAATVAANPNTIPTFDLTTNTGPLLDRDGASGDVSKWRGGYSFPPVWRSYELDVDTDGDGTVDVTYGDSGVAGMQLANDPNGPVRIRFQGAALNTAGTAPLTGLVTPWLDRVGTDLGFLTSPIEVNGFRFELIYNSAAFPNVVVRELRVVVQL